MSPPPRGERGTEEAKAKRERAKTAAADTAAARKEAEITAEA
ncbi:hypothetical protein [Streptomyces sp. LaPpAH-108]|nr:hypothetical protein [Streptomyces sp. LaPpAH-108]